MERNCPDSPPAGLGAIAGTPPPDAGTGCNHGAALLASNQAAPAALGIVGH
jgi:hypothetical protein